MSIFFCRYFSFILNFNQIPTRLPSLSHRKLEKNTQTSHLHFVVYRFVEALMKFIYVHIRLSVSEWYIRIEIVLDINTIKKFIQIYQSNEPQVSRFKFVNLYIHRAREDHIRAKFVRMSYIDKWCTDRLMPTAHWLQ